MIPIWKAMYGTLSGFFGRSKYGMHKWNSSPKGFTLIEALLYVILAATIISGLVAIIQTEARVNVMMMRLDSLHSIRVASLNLSRWLTFGTRLLFPPITDGTDLWADKIMFIDQENVKRLVFLDGERRLKICTDEGRVRVMAERVVDFGVKRIDDSVIVYKIEVSERDRNKTFLLSNTIMMRNNHLAEITMKN